MRMLGRAWLVLAVLWLAGCVTSELYRNSGSRYREPVDQVMVSTDGQWLVVLTTQYHYIFAMPEVLRETFAADFYPQVEANFKGFEINSSDRISGTYRLQLSAQAAEAQQRAAQAIGYSRDGEQVVFEGRLRGQRYASNGIGVDQSLLHRRLNQLYYIDVTEKISPQALAARTLVTPLTVMADGALVLFSIPLVVLIGTDVAINGMPALHSP